VAFGGFWQLSVFITGVFIHVENLLRVFCGTVMRN